MTCERCGAPLRTDLDRGIYVCDYCGTEVRPPSESEGVLVTGDSHFACPLCHGKLADGALESVPLLYCPACHGMLILMNDFIPLLSLLRAHYTRFASFIAPRASDADRVLLCPRCNAQMDSHPYGGGGNVNVDSCESCESIWLDSGELRKIASAPDSEPPRRLILNPGTEATPRNS